MRKKNVTEHQQKVRKRKGIQRLKKEFQYDSKMKKKKQRKNIKNMIKRIVKMRLNEKLLK